MQNIVSTRFIECLNLLKDNKDIRSYRQFALTVGVLPQALNYVLRGKRNVTVELLKSAIETFNFNPIYLYTGEGEKFLEQIDDAKNSGAIITIVTDKEEKERIVHIPIAAQAGYGENIHNPVYFEDLESFSLPGNEFFSRTQRCFDVSGDSMTPTIESGDKVICSFVEQDCWVNNIRTGYVYILITKEDILLKRVENLLLSEGTLIIHSDNEIYPPRTLMAEDLLEIWIVKMKLSNFIHNSESFDQVRKEQLTIVA